MSQPKKCFRNDAVAKVTGQTRYSDDLKFHRMLHGVPVYTDYVHAKIDSIDTLAAEQSKGVVKVITAKDILGDKCYGQIQRDYALLVSDKIRFHGDVVAVVVAETRDCAIAAAKLVQVKAAPLPLILDLEKAMQSDSPLVHKSKGSNVVNHHQIRRGHAQDAFKQCDYILEQDFKTQFIEHAYLEPESAVARLRHDGVMEVYGGMQHPFTTRCFVAAILGVRLADVEVFNMPMGGGFGGKDDTIAIVCARAALAAKLTGCPVKITYDREWSIRESYKRHPYQAHYKMGFNRDGKIQAVECRILADAGAYTSMTPFVTWRSTVQCCGPYEVPHVHADVYGVHTNHVFTGAMRGFGSPQINFMIEQLIEMAAEKAGISEVEMRERNRVRQGGVTITDQALDSHVVSLGEVAEKTLRAIDYENKVRRSSFGKGNNDEQYGIGYAIGYRGMSFGAEGMDFCPAIINGQFDGSILLEVGVHENGQGFESAMILLLAEHLGVNRERIRYRRGSTSNIPDGGASVASRCTLMGGGAVVNAACLLKQQMATLLCEKLHCQVDEVKFENDGLSGRMANDRLTWNEAVSEMYLKQSYPYAFGVFQAPKVGWDEEHGKGNAYFTWVYGCDAVELTVNHKTGKVTLLNYIATHDVGKVVNRPMLLGQYYGGIVQGIGYALSESIVNQEGKIQNTNFNTYRIPRATDVPEMIGIIVENPDKTSPSGAKGIGEPALELVAPAIANAIYRATGKRYFELPIKIDVGTDRDLSAIINGRDTNNIEADKS